MKIIEKGDKIIVEPSFESWMKLPDKFSNEEIVYLELLQQIFRVKDINKNPIPYKLANHQVWWHLDDVQLKKDKAPKIRVVKKSRNTSFTVSSIVSLLMSISEYQNEIIPIVRLNMQRAVDMINDIKEMIRLMKPIKYVDENGNVNWIPFNPDNVYMENQTSIKIGKTEIRAFPANAQSSESIRGIRTVGMAGIIDESNFMNWFENILIALRDSSTGASEHQILVGTTMKGTTPFSEWLEKQKNVPGVKVYDWPIFERDVFESYYNSEGEKIPFYDNDKLVTLVPWQDKKELWDKYLQDEHRFLEEYMAVHVDSEEQFYRTELIMANALMDNVELENFDSLKEKYEEILVGVDVATINDYFVITCVGKTFEGKFEQFYLNYRKSVELQEMEAELKGALHKLDSVDINWYCRIDSFGMGMQLYQNLSRTFPGKVIGNSNTIKVDGKSVKTNEYGHTKIKRLLIEGKLKLINDELLIKHFSMWNYEFKAESSKELGHGDIVMAILYALLAKNIKTDGEVGIVSGGESKEKGLSYFLKMRGLKKVNSGLRRNI